MTTTSRHNNLILNQDWTRIYQTFKNADFKSYDFENLRRVIITYMRENYPEDFNDYIESSEYMALIDAIAFLGQSLAFRIDLASRENFIELAERRESVLRIARMLSYNAKRNIAAKGLLKFTTVTTTEEVLDSNGRNLANQVISWNDPTNANWAEQFLLILNAAMADNTEFGRSQGSDVIQGIPTEQYRFRTTSTDVPIYSFAKTVAGRKMVFELLSTAFKGSEEIYEEPPVPGNQLGFIYRNDSKGPASPNTGFFLMFKQGSLELADFSISVPTTNERISVDSVNINNDDVWLYSLSSVGVQQDEWSQVSSLIGNNIAYNSIQKNIRNIYAVQTRENDRIDLVFADGVYGNLPQGSFRVYYRVSNGLSYVIAPNELRGINITIPYVNKRGVEHVLTVGLALQYTVANAAETESLDSIRQNAPASYYTQNRMITGEDYNLAPLTSSQDILKVKAINRTSSGISRNYEIIDASGKYSSVNVFADDGYVYREDTERVLNFKYTSRIDILNFLRKSVEPLVSSTGLYNFYLTKFDKKLLTNSNIEWNNVTTDVNLTTGYFTNLGSLKTVAAFTDTNLKYIVPGALVKFVPPAGKAFKGTEIVDYVEGDASITTKIWAKVVRVVGDGTSSGTGVLNTGDGPISFNEVLPASPGLKPLIDSIVPKFVFDFPSAIESEITNQIFANRNFGLRYDVNTASWKIITAANLNIIDDFSLERTGDTTNANLDSSWLVSFIKEADQYVVTVRTTDYIFGSKQQNRFYFDANERAYNKTTGLVGKDVVKVLNINAMQPQAALTKTEIAQQILSLKDNLSNFTIDSVLNILKQNQTIQHDIVFEIDDTIKFDDGYESTKEIKIAFSDKDTDGVIDDPEAFDDIVNGNIEETFIFFKQETDNNGTVDYVLVTDETINVAQREIDVDVEGLPAGTLYYFYDTTEDRVKRLNSLGLWDLALEYKGVKGRKDLKFQYIHNASVDRRIDPSSSNIIDIFLLTRSYDTTFRQYLAGATTMPVPPTTESLRVSFGSKLGAIKSVSDEIIYHPVQYKVLFGQTAEDKLKAQFKVVKNPNKTINDNDLKVRIVTAINEFFDVDNWDFGDRFYLGELITYILNRVSPDVSNLVIVPRQTDQVFGSLFEVQSNANEIFVSGATVDDILIVTAINAAEIGADPTTIVNAT